MRSFRKWLESDGSYDQGLHRPQFMSPRFDPKKRAILSVGEKQEDPMYHTLHKHKKNNKKKKNPIDALFGFMKKK